MGDYADVFLVLAALACLRIFGGADYYFGFLKTTLPVLLAVLVFHHTRRLKRLEEKIQTLEREKEALEQKQDNTV